MAEPFVSYNVDNDKRFKAWLSKAAAVAEDLSEPLRRISFDFFKSERAIFMLSGPGQYPDLGGFRASEEHPNYPGQSRGDVAKGRKYKKFGFIYPILQATGRLMESLTDPGASEAVALIVNRQGLILGTKVPYGIYHQSDKPRSILPQRKFLFIGPESIKYASDQALTGRSERWMNILNDFILFKLGAPR